MAENEKTNKRTKKSGLSLLRGGRSLAAQKTLMDTFYPELCLCEGERPANQDRSLSKQTATGLWSWNRAQALGRACTVTQADWAWRRLVAAA